MPKPVAGIDRRPAPDGHVHEIPIRTIHPSDWNPRTVFDDHELDELATSIAQTGLLSPLIVEPDPDEPGQYLLMDGERRYRALQRAGAGLAPCIVRRFATAEERLTAMLTTSLQRADLTPLDEAAAYQRLLDLDLTQSDIATRVSRSKGHVSKRLALLKLPAAAQRLVAEQAIPLDVAGRLAAMPTTKAKSIVEDSLAAHPGTATAVAAITAHLDQLDHIAKVGTDPAPKKPKPAPSPGPVTVTETTDGLKVEAGLEPAPPSVRTTGPGTGDATERWDHLRKLLAGETRPQLRAGALVLDTARVMSKMTAAFEVDPEATAELLDPDDPQVLTKLAGSSNPQDRQRLVCALLLAGAEREHRFGRLEPDEEAALDRIFKDTGYTRKGAAA